MAYYSGGAGGKLSAVDAILAEAADLVALEQIAKLNTAHLADDDSALPSSLEARFRKLKSLPSPAAPPPVRTLTRSVTAPGPAAALPGPNTPAPAPDPPEHHPLAAPALAVHERPPPPPGDAETKRGGSSPREARAPAPVPTVQDADADADEDLERLFGSGPRGRPTLRERNRGRDSSSSSPSPPPRQACCFGFSPKKPLQRALSAKGKKKKVHHGSGHGDVLGVDADEWGDENRRMVSELREQQRRLRKALQDQVQVSRETAKMARWVKQASARMTHVEAIDDLLSDCEDDEEELK